MPSIEYELRDWEDVRSENSWPTLLIGNGASVNLWSHYRYESLFARTRFSTPVNKVFTELDGTNFEEALEFIRHGRVVAEALEHSTAEYLGLYDEIKNGLFDAVNSAHLPHNRFSIDRKLRIADYLVETHQRVFTTNYDLTIYWSLMADKTKYLKLITDHFSGNPRDFGDELYFDPYAGVDSFRRPTALFYLHGAIHLWQDDETGENGKWRSVDHANLLQLGARYSASETKRPLFVSEGNHKEKLRTIMRSPYLWFCIETLANDRGDTVVFGHSLSERQDMHIASALAHSAKEKQIAISLRPDSAASLRFKMAYFEEKFSNTKHKLHFFDSTTHPLGDPALTIPEEDWPSLLAKAK
ncbi:DUF4917 family protein [Promicromonospora sukumoe]|uniref:DUF4917 family protein n=1 Tax=Promicromonospora sukumoe TaxID=88382 RepID=UPI00366493C0